MQRMLTLRPCCSASHVSSVRLLVILACLYAPAAAGRLLGISGSLLPIAVCQTEHAVRVGRCTGHLTGMCARFSVEPDTQCFKGRKI